MAVVLLLLTFCLLLLSLWESVIVLCFVVCYFMSILELQSSWWERKSWLLCLICLPGVSWWLRGSSFRCHWVSAVCDCCISWSYSLTIQERDETRLFKHKNTESNMHQSMLLRSTDIQCIQEIWLFNFQLWHLGEIHKSLTVLEKLWMITIQFPHCRSHVEMVA